MPWIDFINISAFHVNVVVSSCSWSDAVLWNPHLTMEACYKDFVCVENAKVQQHFAASKSQNNQF